MKTIEYLNDSELRWAGCLFEALVGKSDREEKKPLRNFWRSLTVVVYEELPADLPTLIDFEEMRERA